MWSVDEGESFDFSNPKEIELRSPGHWLASIASPTFVFEGTRQGNLDSLTTMSKNSKNGSVQFFPVEGATHFSLIAPLNRLIAGKILKDDGPKCNLSFTVEEVNDSMRK